MGKDKKTPQPREVAVAIPYWRDGETGSVHVCLVSSRKHDNKYVLPKGGVEHGETGWQAAVREMWEEAGLKTTLSATSIDEQAIGTVQDHKPHKHATTTATTETAEFIPRAHYSAFAVPVQQGNPSSELVDWPERHERQRRWFAYKDACEAIAWRKDIHRLLLDAEAYLGKAA